MDYDKLEPGPELDALVAERVMGWMFNDDGWIIKYPDSPATFIRVDSCQSKHEVLFQPSTGIGAAWEVVEKLTADDGLKHPLFFKCNYRWFYEKDGEPAAYVAFDWKMTGDRHPLYAAKRDTMPHAVCIAALKAVES